VKRLAALGILAASAAAMLYLLRYGLPHDVEITITEDVTLDIVDDVRLDELAGAVLARLRQT
jgi:hypothetical protein